MIRTLDILFAISGLILCAPVFLLLIVLGLFDTGSPFFRQTRVGRELRPFTLWKFRTMRPGTASIATHLADASAVTSLGSLLRHTKLDELPQLWNVLRGDMSLVGPRPCLFSQETLIAARAARGIFNARPGITGLAQVNGIDMSTPELLAEMDRKMLDELDVSAYFRYVFITALGKGSGDRVK